MTSTTPMRELITVSAGNFSLKGTYHKPQDGCSASSHGLTEPGRIGILFMDPGFLPRSGPGDNAIYWADAFSKFGYPCFRLDLPGLGDSQGEVPANLLDFIDLINSGYYGPLVSSVVASLCERFALSGVVAFGPCAAGVSAIYAAAATARIKGLILLDPYFHRPEPSTTIRKAFRSWAPRNWFVRQIITIYDRLKYLKRVILKNRLPNNANLPLIRCWKQLVSAGVPILVFTAPEPVVRTGEFDYFQYLAGGQPHIRVKEIRGTNHTFAQGSGREVVRDYTAQWLRDRFSRAAPESACSFSSGRSATV